MNTTQEEQMAREPGDRQPYTTRDGAEPPVPQVGGEPDQIKARRLHPAVPGRYEATLPDRLEHASRGDAPAVDLTPAEARRLWTLLAKADMGPVLVAEAVLAGALMDLAGYLTTQPGTLKVGARHEVTPLLEAVQRWAAERGVTMDHALVQGWKHATMAPADLVRQVLTDMRQCAMRSTGWLPATQVQAWATMLERERA